MGGGILHENFLHLAQKLKFLSPVKLPDLPFYTVAFSSNKDNNLLTHRPP